MVTSILTTPTYSDEHSAFVGNSRVSIEQPLICVDGYIIACRFDGESCNPTFGISMEDLLNTVRNELQSTQREESSTLSSLISTPPKSPSSVLSGHKNIATTPHTLISSRRRLFHQNSRDSNNKKRDSEDLTGVSYDHIEHSSRDSFILPISNNTTQKKRNETLSEDENDLLSDVNDNVVEEIDIKKQLELEPQIEWVKNNCSDYVNTETVANCAELQALLNILMKMSTAALVTLKIANSKEITVTFQFMEKFKRNYMVVKISQGYAMLMKAF